MIFDIKGSTVNRIEPFKTKFWKMGFNQNKIMKDLNYIEINQDIDLLRLNVHEKETLERILELDSVFLMYHNLMDYSLLLIIE
jgi:hypothetical protein